MNNLTTFLEFEKQLSLQAAEKVASDPLVFAVIKKWGRGGGDVDIQFIEHYIRVCAKAFNSEIPSFETFQQAKTAAFTLGHHDNTPGFNGRATIRINTHPSVFSPAYLHHLLDTIPHELAHHRQSKFIRNPMLLPIEFRLSIIPLFRGNFDNYIVGKPDSSNYDAYRNQPIEAHAFIVGDVFTRRLMESVAKHEMLPNSFDEEIVMQEYEKLAADKYGTRGIEMPYPSDGESPNPYRHFYDAKLQEDRLSRIHQGHSGDNKWFDAAMGYYKATVYGEFLAPHNFRPALEGLYRLAANQFEGDRQVPQNIQKMAQNYIGCFINSPRPALRVAAQRYIERLDKAANPVRPLADNEQKPPAAAL